MSIKTLLVPLTSVDISASPLEAAYLVAEMFDAHIEVLHVRPDPRNMIPYVGEGMSGALIEEVMGAAEREAGDRAVTVHQVFERFVARHGITLTTIPAPGVTATWHEDTGREDEAVAMFGRMADLVVVNRPLRAAEVPTATIFEAALFECGQPLLVAPPTVVSTLGRNIMIAWNGSPEAARAVSAALPFLTRADRVSLVTASGWAEGALNIDAAARRLAWHGIDADVKSISQFSGAVGEVVLAEAAEREADMIVMGAYTQSRLRQMILGGVTRHVLSTATVPLIMAH